MVEILPVHNQIHSEGDFVAANGVREFDLVRVRFGARNPIGGFFA